MTTTATTPLTAQQQAAITADDRSLSIEAGAGSGKTFVLTERFLAYVDPRQAVPTAELDELVAITFTDAAAREMRQRIRQRAYDRLQSAADAAEADAWQRLLRGLDSARISTIHAFCTNLLRTFAVEAELDPQFEVLDAAFADLLRVEALDDLLREKLLAGDDAVLSLAARMTLAKLREHLARLSAGDVETFAAEWADRSAAEIQDVWQQFTAELLPGACDKLLASSALQTLTDLADPSHAASTDHAAHLGRLAAVIANIGAGGDLLANLRELDGLARARGEGFSISKKDWVDPDDQARYTAACTKVRSAVQEIVNQTSLNPAACDEAIETGQQLLQLALEASRRYTAAKRARGAVDYDDQLRLAHKLLSGPRSQRIRTLLAASTRLLMVDEFQDTDPLQVEIIKAFCGDDWQQQGLLVVGDFKQSIYRFRGAKPEVSRQTRAALPPESRLALSTNFRSQPAILDFVNSLFCESFADDFVPLAPHRSQTSPTPAVEFLWAVSEGQRVEEQRASEASYIARRVGELMDSAEPIIASGSGELRPLVLGDVAILLRALSDVAIYERALAEQDLPYVLAGGHAFYAQQELYDLLSLLRVLVSHTDEVSLAGALRSPLFSLHDETLFAAVDYHGSLVAALTQVAPPSLRDAEAHKLRRAADVINHLRRQKDRRLVADLIEEALALTGYDAAVLCEFMGERKLANLRKVVEQARQLDTVRPGDLAAFVKQLDEFVVRQPKEPEAALESHDDAIRLMTIHQAKGLEFPLVVVADLARKPPNPERRPEFDERLGPLASADSTDGAVGLDLFRIANDMAEADERLRLLYVACTRAADRLILSAGLPSLENPPGDWMRLVSRRFNLNSGGVRVPLPPGYREPQVQVTTAEPPERSERDSRKRKTSLSRIVDEVNAAEHSAPPPTTIEPLERDLSLRRRYSFSRLSGQLRKGDAVAVERELASAAAIDPRQFGTLVHRVLERVDFDAHSDLAELCRDAAEQFLPGSPAAEEAARELVQSFLARDRAAEIRAAKQVLREVEFLLPWPPTGDATCAKYFHGFVDLAYLDGQGGWHLLDYKTNDVPTEQVANTAQAYRAQMFVYRTAFEQAVGVAPVETVLLFLRPGCEQQFTWSDAEHNREVANITNAMAVLDGTKSHE